jgi:hypothetical protein
MTLEEFVVVVKSDISRFEEAYKTQAALNPETYPLDMPEVNSGLWWEFFRIYSESGVI